MYFFQIREQIQKQEFGNKNGLKNTLEGLSFAEDTSFSSMQLWAEPVAGLLFLRASTVLAGGYSIRKLILSEFTCTG